MISKAKISVLCPSYNHEKYVSFFIDSVLNQTYQNFELIIVDDSSTDKTVDEIKKYSDKRIKLIKHEYNKGINAALNTSFQYSSGDYIVFCASDDILEPNHFETVIEQLNNLDICAVYCNLLPIDEDNKLRTDLPKDFAKVKNQDRYDFLKKGFMLGNIVNSPGMTVKRKYFQNIFPLPIANVQYQDYKIHIELLLMGKILVLDDKLVKYRQPYTKSNISVQNETTLNREKLEESSLLDSFLNITNVELLRKIFKDEIIQTKIQPYPDTIKYFLGRMALLSPIHSRKIWGYHKIMEFYNENNKLLYDRYKFCFKNFLNLITHFNNNDYEVEKYKLKYKKYKRLFNIILVFFIVNIMMCIILYLRQ